VGGGTAVLQFFSLLGPDNEVAWCRSYRVGTLIELRFGVDGQPAVLSEGVTSHALALSLASRWRALLTTTGPFVEA
jgi:hypothetical protein